VSGCCTPPGYERLFGEKTARRDANRYRRRGLDRTAGRMVAFVRGRGVEGQTVLEIGGGVGAIELELLRAGADRAVNVELSPGYDQEALALAKEAGLDGRIDRRHGDFAAGAYVGSADVVVMHRVVCCYSDLDALVGAAAEHARGYLVLSFPRESRLVRGGARVANLWLARGGFRFYVHPVVAILAAAERHGLRPAFQHRGRLWQVAALERA
jgi:magnesium-protoporphyrin O-methyltransferase